MSYIWENYNVDKKYEISFKEYSPYMEVQDTTDQMITVNPLFRLYDFFKVIFKSDSDDNKIVERKKQQCNQYALIKDLDKEIDLFFHILASIDFSSGVTKKEIMMYLLEESFEKFGETNHNKYKKMPKEIQFSVLKNLVHFFEMDFRDNMFFRTLEDLFRVRCLYEIRNDLYLVYIAEKWTEEKQEQLELIEFLFKDIWINVDYIWEVPFGIIEKKESMIVDNITLY